VNVLRRGDEGYEQARLDAVRNGRKPERYPEPIVLAEGDDDVVAAVRLARDEGLKAGISRLRAFSTGNAAKLEGLRARCDPDGLFDSYLGETRPSR
jgi:FAD/FMN-containing dehydrogenase